ncbi:peptidogalycan biosysnthesis protein [Rhizobium sp. IBUN]|uniref:peptidogalycan biosysnthesis protein n=1 Tax=Rhizobium sp. IBUN TaxID=1042326 RepID=UPI000471E1C3|nr:peptidogalycan biosysnthesis protein [Rhizobium sp. IBUN]
MLASNPIVAANPGDPYKATVAHSIREIGRDAWNACFPHEVETYDYLEAVENAGIEGFSWCYVVVYDGPDVMATMPAFLCNYGLETTLPVGVFHAAIERVRKVYPGFLKLRLACLGSPCTETGAIGFSPRVPTVGREELLQRLLKAFHDHAASQQCSLTALKDIPQPLDPVVDDVLKGHGYAMAGGMATAHLDIDFDSTDVYLARLSSGTRKDMRRKLRMREHVRIEYRSELDGVQERVATLYRQTRERSEWQFEELTPDYFRGVLTKMRGRSFCALYFVGDELLAANLLIHNGHALVDKFFCMDADRGRSFNLYYLSWFTNIEYCLRHGIRRYQSGQAYYANKVRLGSKLTSNVMLFRHRNRAVQSILQLVAPLLSPGEAGGGG